MSTQVSITKLAYGGSGIATLDSGKTIFVKGGLPGDIANVEILEEHKSYCNAKVKEILEPSQARIAPKCKYFNICGGCQLQELQYQEQLVWKRRFVVDSLARIGKIENAEDLVDECIASKREWGYRNKIELVPVMSGAKMRLGYHSKGTNESVAIDECLLLPKKMQKAPKALAGALRYLKANEYSLERVSVRTSVRTGSTQVGIWTAPGYFPRNAASNIISSAFKNTGIVRMLLKSQANARKVSKVEILSGEEVWHEQLGDFEMVASGPSFFQVNTAGAEKLVGLAMEGLKIQKDDTCCDLYCGTGTFTLPMADRCDDVLAVESVSSSLRDLRRNLSTNGLDADVIGGDAVREAKEIGEVDKLVMDPPYRGMGSGFAKTVLALNPKQLALISCNPTTLARDIASLRKIGYELEHAAPVDMFPQTFHVETVCSLVRKDGL